jgi:hypothetical protein
MGDLITRLTSLFNLTKTVALTLPGLVGAIAVAILLWPPQPDNVLPTLSPPTSCKVSLTAALLEPKNLEEVTDIARKNQAILESRQRDLQSCSELETSQVGKEEARNANLKTDIAVLEKEQTAVQDAYVSYQKSNSPLAANYRDKLNNVDGRIDAKRREILQNEQSIRDKNKLIQENGRYLKMVTDRLADPGRLRPQKNFDEFLSSLADHAVALILLALVIGYLLDPFNRAIYGALYDGVFRHLWNFLRGSRRQVSNPVKGV